MDKSTQFLIDKQYLEIAKTLTAILILTNGKTMKKSTTITALNGKKYMVQTVIKELTRS